MRELLECPVPPGLSGYRGITKLVDKKRPKPWRVIFYHEGKAQCFGTFATAEEAAWEQDLKRLELGYEDEGFYNYKLQLGQADKQRRPRCVTSNTCEEREHKSPCVDAEWYVERGQGRGSQ